MLVLPILGSTYSGSIRGITAASNRGGLYFRGRTVPSNPQSPLQNALRSAVAVATGEWSQSLDDIERDSWNQYADQIDWSNAIGQSTRLSGQNMYVRSRSQALYAANLGGGAPVFAPSAAPTEIALGVPPAITGTSLTVTAGPPVSAQFDMSVDNSADYPVGVILLFYLSGAIPSGRRSPTTPTNFVAHAAVTAAPSIELIDSAWNNRYPDPVAGQKYRGYSRALYSDGRLSGRSYFDLTAE